MEIGVDSFVAATLDPATGRAVDPARDLRQWLEAIARADEVGLDAFGIGEHHRREYLDSAPAVILAAAAACTRRIRLTSAVTVLSAADPVRYPTRSISGNCRRLGRRTCRSWRRYRGITGPTQTVVASQRE